LGRQEDVRLREEQQRQRQISRELQTIGLFQDIEDPEARAAGLEGLIESLQTKEGRSAAVALGSDARSMFEAAEERTATLNVQREAIQDLGLGDLYEAQSIVDPDDPLAAFLGQEIEQRKFEVKEEESAAKALTEASNLNAQVQFLRDWIPANKGDTNIDTITRLFNTGIKESSPELIERSFKLATGDLTLGEAFLSGAFSIPSPAPQRQAPTVPDINLLDDASIDAFISSGRISP
jgi:hypothetical protein